MSSLKFLKDHELLTATKAIVQQERSVTTNVLRHLEEIERRKLYADLRCSSLFEYAVRELGYSEAAAGRRIQAMRLMREIPELAPKIESGALNLSNICQAQNLFREIKKTEPERAFTQQQKREVLYRLENKSAREGQRVLLEIAPTQAVPRERERIVSPDLTQISFVLASDLRERLDRIRSLLGSRGAHMNFAELIAEMADLSETMLHERRFGKRRALADQEPLADSDAGVRQDPKTPTRYISQTTKHRVWKRAKGQCVHCGSQQHLTYDHIRPFAVGGDSNPENLQLLCSSCNLRRGIQTFGTRAMGRDNPFHS